MQPSAFRIRRNLDGSFASICPHCFRTAASAKTEEELEDQAKYHVCDPDTLALLQGLLANSKEKWDG